MLSPRRSARIVFAVVCSVQISGCGEEGTSDSRFEILSGRGGSTIPSALQAGTEVDPSPDASLSNVVGALILPDGRLVVGDGSAQALKFYGLNGFIRSVGRNGSGPGEFRGLQWIGRGVADTIVAYDSRLRRLSFFSGDGVYGSSIDLAAPATSYVVGRVSGILADNTIVTLLFERRAERIPGRQRSVVHVALYDRNGSFQRIIHRMHGPEILLARIEGLGGDAVLTPMFPHDAFVAVTGNGVVMSDSEQPDVVVWERGGRTTLPLGWGVQGVSRRAVGKEVEQLRARGISEKLIDIIETNAPEQFPLVGGLVAGNAGTVWVRPHRANNGRMSWKLIDLSGDQEEQRVKLPSALDVLDVRGNHLVGVLETESGVEEVHAYEFPSAAELRSDG